MNDKDFEIWKEGYLRGIRDGQLVVVAILGFATLIFAGVFLIIK